MTEKVLSNQSILDFAIQHTGTVQNFFTLAFANGISVSDVLSAGFDLNIPADLQKDEDVYNYYTDKGIKPATALTETDENSITYKTGIGYMSVEQNFKVG